MCLLSINNFQMDRSSVGASKWNQNAKQQQKGSQKVVQDQNYSNQIFYGILSTVESILLFHKNSVHQYNNKMFKHYDRVNYSSKNIHQLRSQLQTYLYVFLTSIKVFQLQNKNDQWTLPQNFNQYQSQQFLVGALKQLEGKDQHSWILIKDVLNILNGQLQNLQFQKVNLSVAYTEQEQRKHKNDVFNQGNFASKQMEERQKEAQNCKNVSQLSAKINTNNQSFSGLNKEHFQENNPYSTNGPHHSSSSHASQNTNQKKPQEKGQNERMDVEINQPQVEEHYIIFKKRQIAHQFSKIKGEIPYLKQRTDYFFVKNIEELKKQKSTLYKMMFDFVVPFTIDNNGQYTKENVQVLIDMKL